MSSTPSSYWCYRCTRFIEISPESTTCPHCSSGFVSSVSLSRHPGFLLPESQYPRTFHLYYNDVSSSDISSSSSSLIPVPASISDLLMSSGLLHPRPENNPASKSAVRSLPTVQIGPRHISTEARCAVCTDPFVIGSEGREMPCRHIYHSDCILPWLSIRNTCPICRHPLPEEPTEESLTIWRLPGGGFAVGRWRGGGEREVPAVYTEMDGGGFGEPRRRRVFTRRARNRGGFFRNFFSFFGRVRSGSSRPSIEIGTRRRSGMSRL